MEGAVVIALLFQAGVEALHLPLRPATRPRCATPVLGEADDVGGAIANTFGEIFSGLFKPNAEKEAEIDRAYAEQLEVAERRRDPAAYARKIARTEARRAAASDEFKDKFAWQRSADPLKEFKKRQKAGKVKPIGYEDEPKGGIPMPMASFGVGGEFGQGGKYDNGERFDLRLPFADQGWVDESEATASTNKWTSRLGSGRPKPKAKPKPAAKKAGGAAATRRGSSAGGKRREPPAPPKSAARGGWRPW